MAVTTRKQFTATTNATTTVFSPVSIQLNNQDDLDVYVALSGGTRVLQLRQSTGSTAQPSHPQVNNTDGLYFPAVSAGTTLYNYTLSSDNNTITFNSALPSGATVSCERRTRDADSAYTSFASGSTIRATDLNNSSTESNFTAQEARNKAFEIENAFFNGDPPTIDGVPQPFVSSSAIIDGAIVNVDINANAAIAGTKINPDFGSQNIATTGTVDGRDVSVDGTKLDTVETSATADQTDAEIKTAYENNANTNAYTDTEKTFVNAITSTATELNTLDGITSTTAELNYVDGVTANVQTQIDGKQPLDSELTELATMGVSTASSLADLTATEVQTLDGITSSTAELNLLYGKSIVTTIGGSATDVQIPSAQAVNERIVELVTEVGGFAPITNETSFPATNPDINDGAGTIVSVKALASNLVADSSGVATIANGAGTGNTVTINGMGNSQTIPTGKGVLVETTSTLHTYTFHREAVDSTGVSNAQTLVNDFNDRYQISNTPPSSHPDGSSLGDGDLWFDTSANVMKVYDLGNTQYDAVTSVGDFKLLTVVPDGATSGSPTFNATIQSYDLRDGSNTAAITSVGQLIVSLNGVIQKPNAGSFDASQEGFYLEGTNGIKFCTAPPSGSSLFVTQCGSAVGIGVPNDNTVSTAKIQSGAITNAHIASNAAIDASKIANLNTDAITEGNAKVEVTRTANGSDSLDDIEFTTSRTDADSSGNNHTTVCGHVDQHGRWFIGPFSGGRASHPSGLTDGTSLIISRSYDESDHVSGTANSYACLHLNNPSPQSATALGKIYFSGYGNAFEGGSIIGVPTGAWGNYPNFRATDITVNLNGYGVNSSTSTSLVERFRFKASGALAVNGISNIGTAGQVLTSQADAPPTWTTIQAGARGGNSDGNAIFWENEQIVTHDYSVTVDRNAGSFGPITINSGITVTVPSTSNWTIV